MRTKDAATEDKRSQKRNLQKNRPIHNHRNSKEDGPNRDGNQNTTHLIMDLSGDHRIMERGHSPRKKSPRKSGNLLKTIETRRRRRRRRRRKRTGS